MFHRHEQPRCALTIDVEDWVQSVYDVGAPLTDCFVGNTRAVLELLSEQNVRATFFVLGLAAEKSPELVRAIHEAGHEVQSHGFGHRLIHTQTPAQFREDIRRAKNVLEDLIGAPVTGYRAPAFSVTRRTLWAVDEIAEAGYVFDSSIFPVRMRRYGMNGLPKSPYRFRTRAGHDLLEVPVCSWRLGPFRLPAGGGGYLRTAPGWYTRQAIAQALQDGHPAVLYMHPYELAPNEIAKLSPSIPWPLRVSQSLGRSTVADKLHQLLTEFRFGSLREVLPQFLGNFSQISLAEHATMGGSFDSSQASPA